MLASVLQLLRTDTTLADLGGNGFVVKPFTSYDQIPNPNGLFITIVWGVMDFATEVQENGPQYFDLYAHIPISVSTRVQNLNDPLDRCDEIFTAVPDNPPVAGGDGWQLGFVGLRGRGPVFTDEGYMTMCRKASYMALGAKVTA